VNGFIYYCISGCPMEERLKKWKDLGESAICKDCVEKRIDNIRNNPFEPQHYIGNTNGTLEEPGAIR